MAAQKENNTPKTPVCSSPVPGLVEPALLWESPEVQNRKRAESGLQCIKKYQLLDFVRIKRSFRLWQVTALESESDILSFYRTLLWSLSRFCDDIYLIKSTASVAVYHA